MMSVDDTDLESRTKSKEPVEVLSYNQNCRIVSQRSQDDSIVCYMRQQDGSDWQIVQKSYSMDDPLTGSKWQRYNCGPEIQQLFLALSETRICNSHGDATTSDSLVHVLQVMPPDYSCSQTVNSADNGRWRLRVDSFSRRKSHAYGHLPRKVRNYYKAQNELIKSFEETEKMLNEPSETDCERVTVIDKWPQRVAIISLCVNIVLVVTKSIAVYLSGSVAIISSLVDSTVDIVASIMIWWTSTAVSKRDPYVYPEGRTRLEPVAVIILSVLMSAASIQLVVEAIERIISLRRDEGQSPNVQNPTLMISIFAIVCKLVLYTCVRSVPSRSVAVRALLMDHRNDVLSNTLAIICAYLGSRQAIHSTGESNMKYVDPLGAILMSIYIMANWWHEGIEQIKLLTGHTATPGFLSKLTWMCLNHHRHVQQIDTVRAFHFGKNFLVEVDIVLPRDMSINQSHDIGESLQRKLERLPDVERAFVHLDYETSHDPNKEHKMV